MKILIFTALICTATAGFLKGTCGEGACGNGNCYKGPFQNHGPTFWCSCDDSSSGDFCQLNCQTDCGTGQKCVFSESGKEVCVCQDCDRRGKRTVNTTTTLSPCQEPCLNGGACRGNRCACPPGLTGAQCELDVDECQLGVQCYNGKCVNKFGSFECVCNDGFRGNECAIREYDDDEGELLVAEQELPQLCRLVFGSIMDRIGEMKACQNGGACEKGACVCPRGFTGEVCELDVNECETNPCVNGATCHNTEGSFECLCVNGFQGAFCETNTDDCINHGCANGSTCIDGIARYTCACPAGKLGGRCEMDDPCIGRPCAHGTCSSNAQTGQFECSCETGYKGTLCETDINECKEQHAECYHGGVCVNLPGSWKCECPRGFNGTFCENAVDTCITEKVVCANGGNCLTTSDYQPVCQCRQGFVGKRCETSCPPGIVGARCDVPINTQMCGIGAPAQCANGGICLGKKCVCTADFIGNHCETPRRSQSSPKGRCEPNECMNNATCINVDDGQGFFCICPPSFEGDVCERKKNPCADSPCFNGATCTVKAGAAHCSCPEQFTGTFCEKQSVVDCKLRGCNNRGLCTDDGCSCYEGFTGPFCAQTVSVDRFDAADRLLREQCNARNCSQRAGDGACDEDCNFYACDYDGGDCSASQKPFAQCNYGGMCSHLFGNGQCDQACNTKGCLFDGLDCLPQVPRCPLPIRKHCADRYADTICNPECNTDGCGYDGGDCAKTNTTITNLRFKIMIAPEQFAAQSQDFLIELSKSLRSPVRMQTDHEGPLVFVWEDEKVGPRIVLEEKTRVPRRAARRGVVAWLEVDVADETVFADANSIVNFVGADIAKKGEGAFGLPIAEAIVSPAQKEEPPITWTNPMLLCIIGILVVSIFIAGVMVNGGDEKRNRKRRIISAPVWMPPTEKEFEEMKRSHHPSFNYYEPKRGRYEHELGMTANGSAYIKMHTSSINNNQSPKFAAEFGGYGSEEEVSKLLLEAASAAPITVEVTADNVNLADGKHGRTALHWLAANSSGKNELDIIKDAQMLIKNGADVNKRDKANDTPLLLAVRAQRTGLVVLLLTVDADPTIFNDAERTPLHEAVLNYDLKTLQILLRDRRIVAEIDEVDKHGRTPLMEAARISIDTKIAEELVKHGAKVECDGSSRKESEVYRGRTALHYAALFKNFEMVQFLVQLNANKDKQDENGQTPLMLAAKEGGAMIVEFLIEQGASIDTTDQMDQTALQLAARAYEDTVVEVIQRALNDERCRSRQTPDEPRKVPKIATKGGSRQVKSVKRCASRKSNATPQSNDSLVNLTPPPSEGSISPPNYLQMSATTTASSSSSSAFLLSPQLMHDSTCNIYTKSSSSSNGSPPMTLLHKPDASPEYQPQEAMQMSGTLRSPFWGSPPYDSRFLINQSTPNSAYTTTTSIYGDTIGEGIYEPHIFQKKM